MSNIYIQEPPTSGKVLLKTSAGDIDCELWCRETPKACRNFIQLCMENYYDGTIFHRLVKGFILQGGDPNGDGTGGESIYGKAFKDEFHSRLRFTRRGLLAMANSTTDDNGSQFFFTLGPAPELQNKHTIFGKVTGDTIFNVLKIEEGLVDHNERPLYPHKILKTEILLNYFDDIVPRKKERIQNEKQIKPKQEKGVKNFGLLSFGDEAEEDESETNRFVEKTASKAKSTHDILDDPSLSKKSEVFVKIEQDSDLDNVQSAEEDINVKERIRKKLKTHKNVSTLETVKQSEMDKPINVSDSDSDEVLNELQKEKLLKRKEKANEIREQIQLLKQDYKKNVKIKDEQVKLTEDKDKSKKSLKTNETDNQLVKDFIAEQEKYSYLKTKPKKGSERELETLKLLEKFKNKLENVKESKFNTPTETDQQDIDEEIQSDNWLSHTLNFEDQGKILAKDASTKQDDWYDVYDPRNPINKRKRGETSGSGGNKHRK